MTLVAEAPAPVASWRSFAACVDQTTLMFAVDAVSQAVAVEVCRGCGVRAPCLIEALAEEAGLPADRRFGTRGGLSPRERARLARRG